MANEGGKPIIKVEMDLADWETFQASFREYQQKLGEQAGAWASTNAGIRQAANAFGDMGGQFEKLSDSIESPKIGKAFANVDKSSKDTSKSWLNISKSIDKSSRDLANLVRDGGKFGGMLGLFGLGGLGALAGGLFAGTKAADSDLADQNLMNRKFGLKPGEEKAFSTTFERAGGGSALLSKIAMAKANPADWRYLMAAGISSTDIQSKDPAELAQEFMRNVSAKGEHMSAAQFGMWAQGTGVTNVADMQSLNAMKSYGVDDYERMGGDYQKLVPQLAADQKTLDEATKARANIEAQMARTEIELEKAFIQLNPVIQDLTHQFADTVKDFSESGELKEAITDTENAFTEIGKTAHWLADKLNSLFGLHDKDANGDPGKAMTVTVDKDGLGANALALAKHPWDYLTGKDRSAPGVSWDYGSAWNAMIGNSKPGSTGSGGAPKNNPGNLRVPGSKTLFQQFDNPDAGALAMDRQLTLYAKRDHLTTLAGMIRKYAPANENNTAAYIADVSARTGFGAGDKLNMNDPRVRAAVEAAMIHQESGNRFAQLDQQHIEALITGKTPGKTDQQTVSESFMERMERAGHMLRDTFSEGGGSQFRMPNAPTSRASSTQQSPYNVHVTVTSPAGSSTTVTAGGVPQ